MVPVYKFIALFAKYISNYQDSEETMQGSERVNNET